MIIANKYELLEKLNSGSFGTVYKGKHIRTGELVAIKIGQMVKESGKSLHHKYIAFIATLLKADPVFRNASEAEREKVAEKIWLVIVCLLMVKAGSDAALEALHGAFDTAAIESTLAAIKQSEVKEYLAANIGKILGTQV
jgi:serine/threonine protein kinase